MKYLAPDTCSAYVGSFVGQCWIHNTAQHNFSGSYANSVVFVAVISSFWTSVDKPTCLTIKVLLVLVSDCICQTQVKQIKYWGGNAVYTSPEELTNDDVSMIREEELICYSWSYVSFYVSICLYMSMNSYDRRGRTNMLQLVLYVWLQQQPSAKFLLAGSELSQNHHPYHPKSPHWLHLRLKLVYFKLCLLHYFASSGLWIHWELRQPTIACQLFNHHSNMKTKMAACVFQTSLTLWDIEVNHFETNALYSLVVSLAFPPLQCFVIIIVLSNNIWLEVRSIFNPKENSFRQENIHITLMNNFQLCWSQQHDFFLTSTICICLNV